MFYDIMCVIKIKSLKSIKKNNQNWEKIHLNNKKVKGGLGVNYLFWQEGYAGGLIPLLNRDGTVVVDRIDN